VPAISDAGCCEWVKEVRKDVANLLEEELSCGVAAVANFTGEAEVHGGGRTERGERNEDGRLWLKTAMRRDGKLRGLASSCLRPTRKAAACHYAAERCECGGVRR
jgi:hypothetical protein